MNGEKNEGSPFAALTFQEQQEKWRAWRSGHMEYREADLERTVEKEPNAGRAAPAAESAPLLKNAAGTRHQQLDAVLRRHEQARNHTGAFMPPSGTSELPK